MGVFPINEPETDEPAMTTVILVRCLPELADLPLANVAPDCPAEQTQRHAASNGKLSPAILEPG